MPVSPLMLSIIERRRGRRPSGSGQLHQTSLGLHQNRNPASPFVHWRGHRRDVQADDGRLEMFRLA